MTTQELLEQLNKTYGIVKAWPTVQPVDIHTFVNVFKTMAEHNMKQGSVEIILGPHGGIMFKGIEITPME